MSIRDLYQVQYDRWDRSDMPQLAYRQPGQVIKVIDDLPSIEGLVVLFNALTYFRDLILQIHEQVEAFRNRS